MDYKFDLLFEDKLKELQSNDLFQYNLIKNKALLSGDGNVVRLFYQKIAPSMITNEIVKLDLNQSFLSRNKSTNAFVFFGLIKMINDGIVRLVTSGGYKVKNKRLNEILKDNNFQSLWELGESIQSGLGDFAYRVAIDKNISDMPIIEAIQPERIGLIRNRGRNIGYIFKKRKQTTNNTFELQEIYTKKNGYVVIEYKVFDCKSADKKNEDKKEISLKKDDRAKDIIDLFELYFLVKDGVINPFVTLNMKEFPIVFKTNTATNSWLIDSGRGLPDTHALESIESALSESLSDMVDEIRKGGIKAFINETLVKKDADGKSYAFDHFNKDIDVTSSEAQEASKLFQIMQGDIRSEKYIETSKYLIGIACNKSGIHPLTVGVTGLESIIASAESQAEREGKTSLRKRELKLRDWKIDLEQLFKVVMIVDRLMGNESNEEIEDILVEFGKYTNPTTESIVNILGQAITNGLTSAKEGQKEFNTGKSEKELKKIYIDMKIEKGMALTPEERDFIGIKEEVQIDEATEGQESEV